MAVQEQYHEACVSLRKPEEVNNPTYDQALRRAAAYGCLFELKILIRAIPPTDLGKQDKNKWKFSALHWAIVQKHDKCAEVLVDEIDKINLNKSALLDVQDADGRTPLHHAVLKNNHPIIRLLVGAGASLEIKDCDGKTPCEGSSAQIMSLIEACRSH